MYYFHNRAWLEGYTKEELLDYIDYICGECDTQDSIVHIQKDIWTCMDKIDELKEKFDSLYPHITQELEDELNDIEDEISVAEERMAEIKHKLSKFGKRI